MVDINTETDILFITREKGIVTTDAHEVFKSIYQEKTTQRLVTKTSERHDGTYYTLNKVMDRDVLLSIKNEINERIPNVRYIWRENNELVVLNQNSKKDSAKIDFRIWTRMVSHRVVWKRQQEDLKRQNLLLQLETNHQFQNNLERVVNSPTKKSRGRPKKSLFPKAKYDKPGRPRKNPISVKSKVNVNVNISPKKDKSKTITAAKNSKPSNLKDPKKKPIITKKSRKQIKPKKLPTQSVSVVQPSQSNMNTKKKSEEGKKKDNKTVAATSSRRLIKAKDMMRRNRLLKQSNAVTTKDSVENNSPIDSNESSLQLLDPSISLQDNEIERDTSNDSLQIINKTNSEQDNENSDGNELVVTSTYPIEEIKKFVVNMEPRLLISKFGLKKFDTPIHGNCGIQALMHHINIERNINMNIYDLEEVAAFRRYLCIKIMEIFLDDNIVHPLESIKEMSLYGIMTEDNILFGALYSPECHSEYTVEGYLNKEHWLQHEAILPLIAFVLKKSIFIHVINHQLERYYGKKNYVSYIHYDDSKPNQMCTYSINNNTDEKHNNNAEYTVKKFPHSIFLRYDYNQHYDMYVSKFQKKFENPKYDTETNTRSKKPINYTSVESAGYGSTIEDFVRIRKQFDKLKAE